MDIETLLKDFKHKTRIHLRWSDHDELGHVNNARYFTFIEEARTRYLADTYRWDWKKNSIILARAEMDFVQALTHQDEVYAYTRISRLGSKSFDIQCVLVSEHEGKKKVAAKSRCVLVLFDYQQNNTFTLPEKVRESIIDFEDGLQQAS